MMLHRRYFPYPFVRLYLLMLFLSPNFLGGMNKLSGNDCSSYTKEMRDFVSDKKACKKHSECELIISSQCVCTGHVAVGPMAKEQREKMLKLQKTINDCDCGMVGDCGEEIDEVYCHKGLCVMADQTGDNYNSYKKELREEKHPGEAAAVKKKFAKLKVLLGKGDLKSAESLLGSISSSTEDDQARVLFYKALIKKRLGFLKEAIAMNEDAYNKAFDVGAFELARRAVYNKACSLAIGKDMALAKEELGRLIDLYDYDYEVKEICTFKSMLTQDLDFKDLRTMPDFKKVNSRLDDLLKRHKVKCPVTQK